MFSLDYRIVLHDYDDVLGESGFFRIECDTLKYGDFFPPEIEMNMSTVWLLNWFEKLTEICIILRGGHYVALSDAESYNAWLEFERSDDKIFLNIIYTDSLYRDAILFKKIPEDIHRKLPHDVVCLFSQMIKEIIQKATCYIADIYVLNPQLQNEKSLSQNERRFVQRIEEMKKKMDALYYNRLP